MLLLLNSAMQASPPGNEWMQLELKNGRLLNGYVLQVTEKNVHLVSSSINQRIPVEQLKEESQKQLFAVFPVTAAPEPAASTTAATLKADLRYQREQLYESVSDLHSPRSYRYRTYTHGGYYLPWGCSFSYPIFHSYRSSPSFSIKIDL
ncbi:MAG: hypothetical protein AAGH72_04925 [Verrucomicrobiota bacterium]